MRFLQLATLGRASVSVVDDAGETPLEALDRSPLLAAMLVFLALQPDMTATRNAVMSLFWPDAATSQARTNLRQLLFRLRRLVETLDPSPLEEDTTQLRLRPKLVRCDAQEFLRAARSAVPGVAEAAHLYQGPFLYGFDGEFGDFGSWRASVARDIDRLAAGALEACVREALADVPDPHTVALAERLHGIDPFREDVHALLIEAIWRREGRHAALRRYAELAALLRMELGCEPDAATVELAARIKASGIPREVPATRDPDRVRVQGPTVVVSPFAALTVDADAAVLAAGLSEDLAAALSRIRGMTVIASSSAQLLPELEKGAAARRLNADYLLEGGVGAQGSRLEIRARLLESQGMATVWTHRIELDGRDVLAARDSIADRVAAALEPGLYAEEARRDGASTASLGSWGMTMRAILLLSRFDERSNAEAIRLLSEALATSPQYAKAHAVMGWALFWRQRDFTVGGTKDAFIEAIACADKAISLDPEEPWGHLVRGFAASEEGDHAGAIEGLLRAVRLSPSFALARLMLGWARVRQGDAVRAVDDCRRAIELSPLDNFAAIFKGTLGLALVACRRFEEALPELREAHALSPEYMGNLNSLVVCYAHLGMMEEASELLAYRRKFLGWDLSIEGAGARLVGFAHRDIFIEGLRKAGAPERRTIPLRATDHA